MGAADLGQKVHSVRVKSFKLALTPVTQTQYRACVDAGACRPAPDWCFSKKFQEEDQPVVCVDWHDARRFSQWAGGRLPSEAEWEYAARGGGLDRKYPWGDEPATCARAVMADAALGDGCGRKAAWPVCAKPAGNTPQGLCDMAGNVWQWMEDSFHADYEGAPADGSAWLQGGARGRRVARGGSWIDPDGLCAGRAQDLESDRIFYLGFRPAKDEGAP